MPYADIILPLAVEEPFTYTVPDELAEAVRVGVRVVVPLGARKYYTGIVFRLHDSKPDVGHIRAIVFWDVDDARGDIWVGSSSSAAASLRRGLRNPLYTSSRRLIDRSHG